MRQKKVEKKPIYATISPLLLHTNVHMCTLTSIMDELRSFCSWKAALDDLIYLLVLLFNLYFGLLFIMQNNTLIFYSAEHLISVKLYLLACITAFCLVCRQCKISQIVHNSDWLQKRKLLKGWNSFSARRRQQGLWLYQVTSQFCLWWSDLLLLTVNKLFFFPQEIVNCWRYLRILWKKYSFL